MFLSTASDGNQFYAISQQAAVALLACFRHRANPLTLHLWFAAVYSVAAARYCNLFHYLNHVRAVATHVWQQNWCCMTGQGVIAAVSTLLAVHNWRFTAGLIKGAHFNCLNPFNIFQHLSICFWSFQSFQHCFILSTSSNPFKFSLKCPFGFARHEALVHGADQGSHCHQSNCQI